MSNIPAPNHAVPQMGFEGALALLRQRRMVRRDGWPAREPSYLYLSMVGGHEHISALRGVHRVSVWVPGPDDLLAMDWRLCAPSERV